MIRTYKKEILNFAEFTITIYYKNVKNISLKYKLDGSIVMSIPLGVSSNVKEKFLEKHLDWLRKCRQSLVSKENLRYDMSLPFSDDKIWLFGKEIDVLFIGDAVSNKTEIFSDKVIVYDKKKITTALRAKIIKMFYKQQLMAQAIPLLQLWQSKIGVNYTGLKIRLMKTRWGSCNIRTGGITLNLLLVCWPIECLEYVIVHELTHLLEANHSKRFHALVQSFLPDVQKRKLLLKQFRPQR